MNLSRLAPSGAWRAKFCAAIDGAELLVEAAGAVVLAHHPKPQPGVALVREAPVHNLRDKPCSDAVAMEFSPHMNVVEDSAPLLIVTAVGARKANDVALFLRDDDELVRGRLRQPLLPNGPPIIEDGTVKKLIPVGTAVSVPPTLGVQLGNG